MKIILPIAIVLFVTVISCAKSDPLKPNKVQDEKNSGPLFLFSKPVPNKLPKDYNLLVNKLKAGTISFEEFYTQLQGLIKPYKRNNGSNSSSAISGRQFGPWSYIPSYCDSENDPVGCREFWRTECMSFCMEKYYMLADALMMEEEAAYVDYSAAINLCNDSFINNNQRDSCKNAAATDYATRLNPIISAYNYASNELYTCEAGCGY
ncbi:hypothetical protein ESA94_01945 [Lacibacter luteus]|uniref:Uncharacterized protein n=1 Tax=Lacibacter luteus TaxID=2508719 RepID=A0A4Q1CL98_9BACT|nr:hypothetical protein [Lacibacter luteus]RXK61798.1 hypothetical protein ESA94_01945 [Lacibacter luteus]